MTTTENITAQELQDIWLKAFGLTPTVIDNSKIRINLPLSCLDAILQSMKDAVCEGKSSVTFDNLFDPELEAAILAKEFFISHHFNGSTTVRVFQNF